MFLMETRHNLVSRAPVQFFVSPFFKSRTRSFCEKNTIFPNAEFFRIANFPTFAAGARKVGEKSMSEARKSKRKDARREKPQEVVENDKNEKNDKSHKDDKPVEPKYGPHLSFPYQKVWSRSILILGVLVVVWYNSKRGKEIAFAKQKDVLLDRAQNVECAPEFAAELDAYPGCVPERCGRAVADKLVTSAEADVLLRIAIDGMKLGGSDGGASILDLHSGAISKGTGFVNVYRLAGADDVFRRADLATYKVVKTKIQHAIAHQFGVDVNKIYLTKPTFFSRMTNAPAKTIHDEYWLPHVDRETYEWFHYTSLLYLNDYGIDFEGGRFIFIDKNNVTSSIEPRKGRVSMFTSGGENLHAVERVTSGTRYALTVSFTCDSSAAISDPDFGKSSKT